MTIPTIGYDGCAGPAALLVTFLNPEDPDGGTVAPAQPWDLWRAGYVQKVQIEDFLSSVTEYIACESEDDACKCIGCVADTFLLNSSPAPVDGRPQPLSETATLAERAAAGGANEQLVKAIANVEAKAAEFEKRLSMFVDPKKHELAEVGKDGLQFTSPVLPLLLEGMAQFIKMAGAENYVEFGFKYESLGSILFTIQKMPNKTPHALRGEAEARLENLRAGVADVKAKLQAYRDAVLAAQAAGQSLDELGTALAKRELLGNAFFDAVEAL